MKRVFVLLIVHVYGNSKLSGQIISKKLKTCGYCRQDYSVVTIDGQKHCLKYIAATSPLSQAVSICAKEGSRPPVPKNAKENADILDFFKIERSKAQKRYLHLPWT